MSDDFETYREGLSDPADNFFAVTPSDVTDFDKTTRAIYVGGDGDVAVVGKDGVTVVFKSALAGSWIPVRAIRVDATNTTATDMVGMY